MSLLSLSKSLTLLIPSLTIHLCVCKRNGWFIITSDSQSSSSSSKSIRLRATLPTHMGSLRTCEGVKEMTNLWEWEFHFAYGAKGFRSLIPCSFFFFWMIQSLSFSSKKDYKRLKMTKNCHQSCHLIILNVHVYI